MLTSAPGFAHGFGRGTLVVGFLGLVWYAGHAQQLQGPMIDYLAEATLGIQPVSVQGPFGYWDFVRLLLRRSGAFRLTLTRELRDRTSPRPDLWSVDLPGVLKIQVTEHTLRIVQQPDELRLGVGELYNLPVIVQNQTPHAIELKLIGRIGEDGPTNRLDAAEGLSFFSFNLRARRKGRQTIAVNVYAEARLGDQPPPPESSLHAQSAFPIEVAGWGALRLRTDQPARLYVTGSDGLAYSPATALSRITWASGDYFFYSTGEVQMIRLPAGRTEIEAMRGFEFEPVLQIVDVAEDASVDCSLSLKRVANMTRDGWYSGDVHIHANYFPLSVTVPARHQEFITPENIRDQAQAEDLHVSNLMVANSRGAHIHDEQYFEGRPHRLSTSSHILYWGEEMRNAGFLGHICIIGIKSLIRPLYTGFSGTPHPFDFPPNHIQALAAREQGGAVSYAHPAGNFTNPPTSISAKEFPVDIALGSIDALDVMSNADEDSTAAMWYRVLNTGLRCAISAGSDSFTNGRQEFLPGAHRVYVQVGGELRYKDWVRNYKAGRSFATNAPLLRFTVDGKPPGTELKLPSPRPLRLEAWATSILPFDTLELVGNGEVIARGQIDSGGRSGRIAIEYTPKESLWLAARVRGPYHRLLANDKALYAHTSPIYCEIGGRPIAKPEDARFFMHWIDSLISLARNRNRYADEEQKRAALQLFLRGRAYYQKVAGNGS